MSEHEKQERGYFSGATLGQALLAASEALGLSPDQIAYSAVEGRRTSLKGTRRMVIAVDLRHPQKQATPAPPPAPARAPRERPNRERERPDAHAREPRAEPIAPRAIRPPETELELRGAEALGLLVALSGLETEGEIVERDGGLEVELLGRDRSLAVGRHGEVLRAFDHLLLRMIGETEVRVDAGGFRARQEEALREVALEACRAVQVSGESVLLDELAPAERRVVHLAVREQGLRSASEGEGFLRRIRIEQGSRGEPTG